MKYAYYDAKKNAWVFTDSRAIANNEAYSRGGQMLVYKADKLPLELVEVVNPYKIDPSGLICGGFHNREIHRR